MRSWVQAHRLPAATGALVLVALVSALFGDRGLPTVSDQVTQSPIPTVALSPAVAACLVVLALRPPWPALEQTFGRSTYGLRALWLALGAGLAWLLLLLAIDAGSAFGKGDLARNVLVFTAAAAVSATVAGPALCWVLPVALVLGAFVPEAGEQRRPWAVVVWTGSETSSLLFLAAVTAALCLPLVLDRRVRH